MNETRRTRLKQLQHALDLGAIDQDTYDAAVAAIDAQLSDSGAIAQGPGAMAAGAGGVVVDGELSGTLNLGLIVQQGTRPGAKPADLCRAYLARMLTQGNQLPLFAGDGASAQISLASVYTALLTDRGAAERGARQGRPAGDPRRLGEAPRLSALDVLNAERRLVLLGGPGSGKSTFVNFVAMSMAGELLGGTAPNLAMLAAPLPQAEEGGDDEPRAQHWDHGALLPVQVILRDLASRLPAPGTRVNADAVWDYLRDRLAQAALGEFAPLLQEELLSRGGLVLFDGLDEVPDAHQRRDQIKQAVQDFAASFSRCRFLVTSRSYAYQRQAWKLDDFAEAQLLPFTPGQVRRFIGAWYEHMAELGRLTASDASGRAELLAAAIGRNPRLAELAERPLLPTLIARLHTERGGALPEKREELYAQALELLLNQWEMLKVRVRPDGSKETTPSLSEWLRAGRDEIRRELEKLAFEAHRDQAELVGTADIRQERLVKALMDAAPDNRDLRPGWLVEHLSDRAGLLAAHGEGLYQFPHRSFQEYLAACHLTGPGFPDELAERLRADPNRWRESTLLAAAKVARGTPEAVWSLVDALCPPDDPPPRDEPAEAEAWGALLAAQALWETGLACPDPGLVPRNEKKRGRVQRWARAIVERGWLPAADRALAGRALALLGDERDFDELVPIPAGEFWMGGDGYDDERPRHRVRLPAFRIGRYPVTNAQFLRFVAATGREWNSADAGRPEMGNHPARHVSFHDALAYCDWLSREWRVAGRLGGDEYLSLPSEAEWEYAARGVGGDEFPWGEDWLEDHANTAESGIGDTCAVGMFGRGRSKAGCLDMAGNVWEWTRSLWGEDFAKPRFVYPYEPDDAAREDLQAVNEVRRVVRGGSWDLSRDFARCAYRDWGRPVGRGVSLGFRVVLRSSPVR